MSNTITDVFVQFKNEAAAYEKKARAASGSDRKVFRRLSALTKDHGADVQDALMLAFTRPLMNLITPEFARTLIANVRQTDRGVGHAFKESANLYIEEASMMERNTFGGVVFTHAVLEYLNLVNWSLLGQYIESVAGDTDEPTPKTCGRQDCKVSEKRIPDGWVVECSTCGRKSGVEATKPQAVAAWNQTDLSKPDVACEELFETVTRGGYTVSWEQFMEWPVEQQENAANYVSSGGRTVKPFCLHTAKEIEDIYDVVNEYACVPIETLKIWTSEDRLAAYEWAKAQTAGGFSREDVPSFLAPYLPDGK